METVRNAGAPPPQSSATVVHPDSRVLQMTALYPEVGDRDSRRWPGYSISNIRFRF